MYIHKYVILFLSLLLFAGCATLNQSEINNAQRGEPGKLKLQPLLDIYGERIDIIRNREDMRSGASGGGDEEVPYHDAGLYLGNGLFYDLNGNLSLLILHAAGIGQKKQFALRKKDHTTLFNRVTVLKRDSASYSAKIEKGVGLSDHVNIRQNDSVMHLIKGTMSNQKLIHKSNGDYEYKRALAGEKLRKMKNGYYIKKLLSRDEYVKRNNAVMLGDDIVIRYRQHAVEIMKSGWGREKIKYQMIFTGNGIMIYNKEFTGYKIEITPETIIIYKNQRLMYTYTTTGL